MTEVLSHFFFYSGVLQGAAGDLRTGLPTQMTVGRYFFFFLSLSLFLSPPPFLYSLIVRALFYFYLLAPSTTFISLPHSSILVFQFLQEMHTPVRALFVLDAPVERVQALFYKSLLGC